MAVPAYPRLVAQGLVQRRTQADADILHRVVVVDMGVALGGDLQVETAVLAEGFQHVGQERHGGFHLVGSGAIQVQGQFYVGFFGFTFEGCGAIGHRDP